MVRVMPFKPRERIQRDICWFILVIVALAKLSGHFKKHTCRGRRVANVVEKLIYKIAHEERTAALRLSCQYYNDIFLMIS
jgi:hypothetical protein